MVTLVAKTEAIRNILPGTIAAYAVSVVSNFNKMGALSILTRTPKRSDRGPLIIPRKYNRNVWEDVIHKMLLGEEPGRDCV